MGCSQCQENIKRKTKINYGQENIYEPNEVENVLNVEENAPNEEENTPNEGENSPNENEYAPKEVLQVIINTLIERKKYLENKLKIPQCSNNHNNNTEMKYPEGYQNYINQLVLNIAELEQKDSKGKIPNNSKIIINFYTMTGQASIANVDKETKLCEAFKMAFSNERYTINSDRKTQFSDDYSKTSNSRERFDFENIEFSFNGDIISEKFMKNEPVSSLGNNLNSPISILVILPFSTKIISKTKYNYYYQ